MLPTLSAIAGAAAAAILLSGFCPGACGALIPGAARWPAASLTILSAARRDDARKRDPYPDLSHAARRNRGAGGTGPHACARAFLDSLRPIGFGQSTLLAIVGGLCRPTGGSVRVADADILFLQPRQLADFRGRSVGFVFQFASLLSNLRAVDNVALPG